MKVEVKKLPKSRVSLEIVLSADEFAVYYDRALDQYVAEVRLPGFRKGKVPKSLVENHIGRTQIRQSATEKAIPNVYYEAIETNHLHPIDHPTIDLINDQDGFSFKAEVDVFPSIEVKDWQKIKVKPAVIKEVTQDEVNKFILSLRREKATLASVDRPAMKGDLIVISYRGQVDKIVRDDMSSNNHPLILGEGNLIPGFEDQLVGLKKDEQKTFEIVFPKKYGDKSLAGRKAEFTMTVNGLQSINLPDLNDRFAAQYDFKTVDDMLAGVKEQLSEKATEEARLETQAKVAEELSKKTKVDIPESLIKAETDRLINEVKERYDLNDEAVFNDFLNKQKTDIDGFRNQLENQANDRVKISLALNHLVEERGLDVKDKQSLVKVMDDLIKMASN